MKLTTSFNDTSIEDPDDDTIFRSVLSIIDGHLDGEQVYLAHGPGDDERILSVAAYYDGTGWYLWVTHRGRDEAPGETYCTANDPLSTSRTAEILQQHAKGDTSWQREFRWKPVKAMFINSPGVLVAVLAFIIAVVALIWFHLPK